MGMARLVAAAALVLGLVGGPVAAGPDDLDFPEPVAITAEDIAWFRGTTVAWTFAEAGAPMLLPPGETVGSFADFLGTGARASRFERVLLAMMLHGSLENATYPVDPDRLSGSFPVVAPAEIAVLPEHRRLLARAWWRQGYIDFKYPFGNYHYTEADIALALGEEVPLDATGTFDLPPAREAGYMALYHELPFVLAVWIERVDLAPGTYRLPFDGWEGYRGLRETPVTEAEMQAYVGARDLLVLRRWLGAGGPIDPVIDWMRINEALAGFPPRP